MVSFFSSGFPSHVRKRAIDISSPDMETFLSPVEGVVAKVEKFYVGRPNRFAKVNYDYLIFIESKGRKVKVLHVEPWVKEGDYVKKGDTIGKFLENPYTGGDFPHAHVEGIPIRFYPVKRYDPRGVGEVVKVTKDYFDVEVKTYSEAGPYRGLGCCGGLLNASLPYAGYGGIIGARVGEVEVGGVKFFPHPRRNYTLFESYPGLIRSWEYEAAFKVLEGRPVFGQAFFEAVLSVRGYPMVRFFVKTELKEGEEVDLWELISRGMKGNGKG